MSIIETARKAASDALRDFPSCRAYEFDYFLRSQSVTIRIRGEPDIDESLLQRAMSAAANEQSLTVTDYGRDGENHLHFNLNRSDGIAEL
jgi:hypothetical protein